MVIMRTYLKLLQLCGFSYFELTTQMFDIMLLIEDEEFVYHILILIVMVEFQANDLTTLACVNNIIIHMPFSLGSDAFHS